MQSVRSSSSKAPAAAAETINKLLSDPTVQRAFQLFESQHDELIEEQIRFCSIPAPPFQEAERAAYLLQRFQQFDFAETGIDQEGNCWALRPGNDDSKLIVISAHLDTVFPPDTDVTVKRSGNKLRAPGISDDCCGLTALVALANALQETNVRTDASLLFVGTVGEEGEGNLRGVRYLMTRGRWAAKVSTFISFDGAGIDRITNQALASRRYRVTFSGSGGHSWADFGVANPVHALGRAVAKLASYPLPEQPRTTFNVGRIQGGASINAIPENATMDVDLRSASEQELLRLDSFFRRCARDAVDAENAGRTKGSASLQLNVSLIGDRPGGETAPTSPLIDFSMAATRAVGTTPQLDLASTDSNLPMSLGIPAVTLGAGGTAGNSHTLDEWFDPRDRHLALQRALLVLLAIAGKTN
jgi:acetylornithine deacetylase/succinyl-diaminopimelate desuccinylase-like protein